jgi:hypothetical protein
MRAPASKPYLHRRHALDEIDLAAAWRGVAWRGVAWRGVAWRSILGVTPRLKGDARLYQQN